MIDVRTPSFINFKINLKNEGNLETLNTRLDEIDLISNFYVQEPNKDYAVINKIFWSNYQNNKETLRQNEP